MAKKKRNLVVIDHGFMARAHSNAWHERSSLCADAPREAP